MFNFDEDFQQRWHSAPPLVRQVFHNDLARIEQLLEPDTDYEQWQRHEEKASKQSQLLIEQTYLDMIQNLKVRKQNLLQLVLEKKLAQKRAEQVAQSHKLKQEELEQSLMQTQMLQQLGVQIRQEINQYADRYQKNTPAVYGVDDEELAQAESLRLRLDLESENVIQNMVQQFRKHLRTIAKDEIEYLLQDEPEEQQETAPAQVENATPADDVNATETTENDSTQAKSEQS